MIITQLKLENFRLHEQLKLIFTRSVTLLQGLNASGKTSVLEAIMLASQGRSFRASTVDELVKFEAELSRVLIWVKKAVFDEMSIFTEPELLEMILSRGVVQGRHTSKLLWRLNDVKRRRKDVTGKVIAVSFRPEDMRLVEGSPGRRRDYLNTVLSVVHPSYADALHQYNNVLLRLNKLLWQVREKQQPLGILKYWHEKLVQFGTVIQTYRQQYLEFLNTTTHLKDFSCNYVPKIVSLEKIEEYLPRAVAAGHMLLGPQKDDFQVSLAKRDLMLFGSRGQQRLGVLWLKMGELEYLRQELQDKPVLLLDDIMSELDLESRKLVLTQMQTHQTIVTSADDETSRWLRQELGEGSMTVTQLG